MTIRTRTFKVIGAWNSRVKMKKEGIPQKLKKLHLEDNHRLFKVHFWECVPQAHKTIKIIMSAYRCSLVMKYQLSFDG